MRRLILILAAAVPLAAATTTVTQTIVGPDGQPGSGVAYIRITAPCSYGGSYVVEKTIAVKFAPSGTPSATTFSVALVPNVGTNGSFAGTGACAGTSYTVSWVFTGGQPQPAETWLVPVSATPVLIDAVKTGPLPAPTTQINPSQISTEGGTVGNSMCLTVSGWAAGVCGGAGILSKASTTATLGPIADGTCMETTPFNLAGALAGDTVFAGTTSTGMPASVVLTAKVVSANVVAVDVCNLSGSTYTVSSATFTVAISR